MTNVPWMTLFTSALILAEVAQGQFREWRARRPAIRRPALGRIARALRERRR
jgi:hypothetical protein